ncbi:MAG: ArsR family transcriptional regulator [Chloroflexi bacterium]|nr:ArsR family transcriptional regulator [Chloroflexota bacterium]
MKTVESVRAFGQIKLLADARRMEILRLLMASPATLTQLAAILKQSPAWVRHHILALQKADLIEISELRRTGKVIEKFYRAKAGAFILQELVLPKSKKPVLVFSGSHDLALEGIAEHLSKHVTLLNLPVGSLDGLVNLRQGLCQISGAHLLDVSGEYNAPFVKRLFPDREMEMVTLAHRTQGLIFAAGNPKAVRQISDLTRKNIRFVNRNAGSGTRLWLDTELGRLNIPAKKINGYEVSVKTHSEAAQRVAEGKADVSIGLQAAAHQFGLGFIPLFEERYDLILPREGEQVLAPLLEYLQTAVFRQALNALTGYNTSHSGEQIPV